MSLDLSLVPKARVYGRSAGARPTHRVRVDGRRFVVDGRPWRWRGVTAFRIVDQVSKGQLAEARAYLEWAARTGFNLARVNTTAKNAFMDLTPADGRRSLPAALELCAEYGLYAEPVAVIDTNVRPFDWNGHAREVAVICAGHVNAVFEWANEPGHGTQVSDLHDMADVTTFARQAVAGLDLAWAAGAGEDELPEPGGAYRTRHLDRGRDSLNQVRRVRELYKVVEETGTPVVNDEPIGADELDGSVTGRQRKAEPWFFFAMGALEQCFGLGGTFHLQDGLATVVPGPVQQRCAAAYLEGTRILPDGERRRYLNARHAGSPVLNIWPEEADHHEPETPGGGPIVRAYSFVGDAAGVTVVLHRPEHFDVSAVTLGNGWRSVGHETPYPHVTLMAVAR